MRIGRREAIKVENRKLQLFMDKAINEELFRRRMEQASSLQDALAVLKGEGLEMGAEEFRSALKLLLYVVKATKGELSETDLDSVAGGVGVLAATLLRQGAYGVKPGMPAAARMASVLEEKFLAGRE
jgi:hypothetical protein